MELKLDLHIHSEHSPDGRMPLNEIVSRCKAKGLNGCAVCDHDRVLTEAAVFPDFLLIPGVEVSTQYGHLLGLFVSQPIETRDFEEAVQRIHAQGGIAVLAHPFEHHTDPSRIEPIVHLLNGVEVWNSRADRKISCANIYAECFAEEHQLRCFAGSDAHLPQEVGNGYVTVEAEAFTLDAAKAALLQNAVTVHGRRSPARYAAMSQLTKRKKTGASPAAYIKWGLFAAKCCAQDLLRKGE
ncbi:MAG: CehA/McbA family metallohydrolase [Oscillospiraceae bacterium]|nr:CehA/McbA family metallohydrolase [Oscillospiraceae bacterium]